MPDPGSRRLRLLAPERYASALSTLALIMPFGIGPVMPFHHHRFSRGHGLLLRVQGRHHRHHRKHTRRHHHHRHHHLRVHGAGAQGGCQDASQQASALSLSAARSAVVCLLNQQRTSRGLPPLSESGKLDRSAQNWTDHMVSTADFSHGANFAGRITASGYAWQTAGENIAAGQDTPQQVVTAWMASPEHCHNVLQPVFMDIGVGMSTASVPAWNTDPVTWTTDFGLSMGASPASHNMGPANGCPYH